MFIFRPPKLNKCFHTFSMWVLDTPHTHPTKECYLLLLNNRLLTRWGGHHTLNRPIEHCSYLGWALYSTSKQKQLIPTTSGHYFGRSIILHCPNNEITLNMYQVGRVRTPIVHLKLSMYVPQDQCSSSITASTRILKVHVTNPPSLTVEPPPGVRDT